MAYRKFSLGLMLAALAASTVYAQDSTQDQLVKALAGVFMVKEGGNIDAASNSMRIFQGVVNEEIFQAFHNKTRQEENVASIPQQLQDYLQTQIVQPAQAYFGESLQQHLSGLTPNITEVTEGFSQKPDLSYFTDPNQNPAADILKAFTPAGTSVGSVTGPDFISYAPCLVSNSPAGVALSAAAINFIPQLISLAPQGVGLFPSGILIQPSLIYVSPYGLYATPVGVNVAPSLITVAPYLDDINPVGVNINPTGISVATPASPTRKLLAGEDGAAPKATSGSKAASAQGAPSAQGKALPTDPVDIWLQSYGPWASLMSKVAAAHGGEDHSKASSFMTDTLDKATLRLKNFASLNLTDLLPAGVTFTDPQFFRNAVSNVTSATSGFTIASAFLNYAPCLVGSFPAGVQITAAGIEFSPTGILINPAGLQSQVSGINLQPTVILIEPTGSNVIPYGVNTSPTLISITPAIHVVAPQAVQVADALIAIDATTGVASGPAVSG